MGPEEEIMAFIFVMALTAIPILAIIKSKKKSDVIDQKRIDSLEKRIDELEKANEDRDVEIVKLNDDISFVNKLISDK
jgi:cell division protein FtsL